LAISVTISLNLDGDLPRDSLQTVFLSINQSINQSISLIETLQPDSRIANDMQLK